MFGTVAAVLFLIAPGGTHRQSSGNFEPGISLRLFNIGMPIYQLSKLAPGQTPNIDRKIDAVNIPNGGFELKENFHAELSGEFNAKTPGAYTFRLTSDDGSRLMINKDLVVLNDGVHPAISQTGEVTLISGWHKLEIQFFQHTQGAELKLEWKGPGQSNFVVADGSVLRCPSNLTRVVSPGEKLLLGMVGKRRPGRGLPLEKIHPGWTIQQARPSNFKPQVGALAFLPNGSLLVSNFQPNQSGQLLPDLRDGVIYRLDGVQGKDPEKIRVVEVAKSIQEPLGLATITENGSTKVYVSQRSEVSELVDADGDGYYESTRTVAKAWVSDNYHHFTFGLAEKNGYLYVSLSTTITFNAPGINGPNPRDRGSVLKIDPKRYNPAKPYQNIEVLTGGHRTPNGIEVGPNGLILVGENQGSWQPSNKLNAVRPGAFFGHYNNIDFKTKEYPNGGVPGTFDEQPLEPPVLHLPQNEVSNSPGQAVEIPSGPMKGQLLISDVKYGGLRRAFLEKVGETWQGGVVPYSQGFEVGTNRMIWGPDGSLYIGGIGATETWAWTDPKTGKWTTFGLQKITPNGKSVFEIESVTATQTGFKVRFTKPLSDATLKEGPANWISATQWTYAPTVEYGGGKIDNQVLPVRAIRKVSEKGLKGTTTIFVDIDGLKEDRVVHLDFEAKSSQGEELWATECWYTLNKIPGPIGAITKALVKPNPNVLVFSETKGFRHDSISAGLAAINDLAKERGFTVTATEDSAVFNDDNLAKFDSVVFLCTTGDILNPQEQVAFERFINSGGGFVGIHSATDTEYDWPYYMSMIGGAFRSHPPGTHQAFIKVEDRCHPTTVELPNNWLHDDEWYNFKQNPRSKVRVLASLDESSYKGGDMGDHPIIWTNQVEKGRVWYTGLGHTREAYSGTFFRNSLAEGILWVSQSDRTPKDAEVLTFAPTNGWVFSPEGTFATPTGGSPDLISKQQYGDCHVHAEFKIPKNSNSGVYVQGRYEIQVLDSFGKAWKDLAPSDCGGVYERWINDKGVDGTKPLHNAFRGPGTWNTYDILFRAPRFVNGKIVEKARFVEVRLNGVVIQREVILNGPTRGGWEPEVPLGPIRFQGDHGPVEYRSLWVRKLSLNPTTPK